MSIISDALNKQNASFSYRSVKRHSFWRIMLVVFLATIILLLGLLIWMLSRPPVSTSSVTKPDTLVEKVVNKGPEMKVAKMQQPTMRVKSISHITFDTKPLPKINSKVTLLNKKTNQEKNIAVKLPRAKVLNSNTESLPATSLIQQKTMSKLASDVEQARLTEHQESKQADAQADNVESLALSKMDDDFQRQVPAISYAFHVYSSVEQDRWVRINGVDVKEGEFDPSGKIQVLEIHPNETVFRCAGRRFSLFSLQDWKGF